MGIKHWLKTLFLGTSEFLPADKLEPVSVRKSQPSSAAPYSGSPLKSAIRMQELDQASLIINHEMATALAPTFIRLEGVLNLTTAEQLESKLRNLVQTGEINLVVDFIGVPYVSSRAWGTLISMVQMIRKQGGDIKVANLCPNVMKLFYHTGLSAIFEVFDSLPKRASRED